MSAEENRATSAADFTIEACVEDSGCLCDEAALPCGASSLGADISSGEAIGLLIAFMELMGDHELEEQLAALDTCAGGALAAWQPPWAAEEIDELSPQCISRFPEPSVIESAKALASTVDVLCKHVRDENNREVAAEALPGSNGNSIVVVVPDQATRWQAQVIRQLVRLVSGRFVHQTAWNAEVRRSAAVLPCSVRIINLGSLEACTALPERTSELTPGHPDPRAVAAESQHGALVLKTGFLMNKRLSERVTDVAVPDLPHVAQGIESAECAAFRDTVASEAADHRGTPCIQFIHLQPLKAASAALGEAAGLIVGTMHLLNHACVQQALAALDALSGGMLAAWQPPWSMECIEDVSIENLSHFPESTLFGWAMNLDGFVSFLARFAAAAMRSGWVPGVGWPSGAPNAVQMEEVTGPAEPDSEGAEGVAPAAAASVEAERAVPACDVGGAERGARPPLAEAALGRGFGFAPPARAPAQAECVLVAPGDDEDDEWEAEGAGGAAGRAASAALEEPEAAAGAAEPELPRPTTAAVVVVLPDEATRWHLEVLGALVSSMGVYMIYESAWRTDFSSASNVPFSIETMPSQQERNVAMAAPHSLPRGTSVQGQS